MQPRIWKIEWNDEMRVGIPEVDADHKRFISMFNGCNQAIASRMELSEIKSRLQLLLDDAGQHFAHEERLLREWEYPDTENHANRHREVLKALQEIRGKFMNYDFESEWIEMGLAVKDILITHILKEDMKYADFYRKYHGSI